MTDPTANDDQPKVVTPGMPAAPPWPEHDWHLTEPVGVWPPTSERDAHLGAYAPLDDGSLGPAGPNDHDAQMFRKGWMAGRADALIESEPDPAPCATAEQQLACPWRWAYNEHIGAPAGLTAAQEIRRDLAVAALTNYVGNLDQTPAQVAQYVIEAMLPVAYAVEFGVDDIDAACPDPALHEETHPLRVMAGQAAAARDEARETVASQVLDMAQLVRERDDYASRLKATDQSWTRLAAERDDLKTELLEAHADLEASQAREQIAQERAAKVLAWAECECGPEWTERRMHGPDCHQEEIRAILAGDQDEEAT
jgi:hypothetical protein